MEPQAPTTCWRFDASLDGVKSNRTLIFINTNVRTSNLAQLNIYVNRFFVCLSSSKLVILDEVKSATTYQHLVATKSYFLNTRCCILTLVIKLLERETQQSQIQLLLLSLFRKSLRATGKNYLFSLTVIIIQNICHENISQRNLVTCETSNKL